MRAKLQNSKGYAESPEFPPALGLLIEGVYRCKLDPWLARLQKKIVRIYEYTQAPTKEREREDDAARLLAKI